MICSVVGNGFVWERMFTSELSIVWKAVNREAIFWGEALDATKLIYKPDRPDKQLDELMQKFFRDLTEIMSSDHVKAYVKALIETRSTDVKLSEKIKDVYIIGKINHVDIAFLPHDIMCALKVAKGGFVNYDGEQIRLTVDQLLSSCIVVAMISS